ncbi:MAG: hypothetical protein WAV05_03845 [Anaerolineales bacterium]
MENLDGCQIPCLPKIAEGKAEFDPQPIDIRIKRLFAKLWNTYIKKSLKRILTLFNNWYTKFQRKDTTAMQVEEESDVVHLKSGDWVRVRSLEEIQNTLDLLKELKGCAFLEGMKQYCGTQQRVLKVLERFLDERDYQVKKAKGIVLLEGVYCQGTAVFGRCDRSCLTFWREEWLEKIDDPATAVA